MPRSKRAKVYHLSKTKKKGRTVKDKIVEEMRAAADAFKHCFVFKSVNTRNNGLKALRKKWKDSRVFMGKNKVMALALGKTPESEHKDNLHQVAKQISGDCGVLFTNFSEEQVKSDLASMDEIHFARAGFIATEDFELKEGVIEMPFSMETQLRKYGLATILKEGKIILSADTQVCKIGDRLTPEQCKLLELFQVKMARFRMYPVCFWDAETGNFEEYHPPAWAFEQEDAAGMAGGFIGGFMED